MFSLLNLQIVKYKYMKKLIILLSVLLPVLSFAQDPAAEEDKKLYEAIQKEVDRYTDLLDLEDWQIFYVDSILTHNYTGMVEELKSLNNSKVSNPDLFYMAQDRWHEKTYQAFQSVFNEEQWPRYLKSGGARDKKARDKRADKRNK